MNVHIPDKPTGEEDRDALQGISFDEVNHEQRNSHLPPMNIMVNELAQSPSPVYLHSEAELALKNAMQIRIDQSQEKTKNLIVNERRYLSPRTHIRTTNTKNMSQINVLDVQLKNKASSASTSTMMLGRKISNQVVS